MDTRNKIFAVVGTVAILATAGIAGIALFTSKDNSANTSAANSSQTASSNSSAINTTSTNSSSSNSASSGATATSSSYKDGTYTASIGYYVPHGGQNTLKATVVISSGKISSATTSDNYTDRESGMYVQSFESSVSGDASGQSIGSYSPSRIGGASLTTQAFADALYDIANQAKA